MTHLLLKESIVGCGPSHEDIMASKVLAFLSSSELNTARPSSPNGKDLSSSAHSCARFLLQGSQDLLNNNNRSSSRSSSDSMESFRSNTKRDFFSGFDPVSNDFSDLDDDGLHGDRMKPLSSLKTNYEARVRLLMPQFSRRRGSNSPANRTPSKVMAAARVGRRARRKAMYYCDNKENKENNIMAHASEMQERGSTHKGVKRKSEGHQGNACFLALQRKRPTQSSCQKMMSTSLLTPFVSRVTAAASMPNCKDMQVFTKSPQRTNLSSKEAANLLLEASNGIENVEQNSIVLQGSAQCQTHYVTNACSTLAFQQGSGLPIMGSCWKETSCSPCVDHSGKELHAVSNGENLIGLPCRKPPTYPKDKQSTMTILTLDCSDHVLVDATCGKDIDVAEFDDQATMNNSSSTLMETQCQLVKIEAGSEDLTDHEGPDYLAAGTNVGHSSCSVSHFSESSAISQSCKTQVDTCKRDLPESTNSTQILAGLSVHPSVFLSSGNKSDSPCQSDNVLVLTPPLCLVSAAAVSNSDAVVKPNEVKQETSSQDSAEMHLNSQTVNLSSGLLPRNLSTSARAHIKDSARQTRPDPQTSLDLSSQLGLQKSKDHPSPWPGVTIYQRSLHNSISLPKFRRGRPPRKSNLCPCPDPKENTNKFSRICAPSGVLGKLNPGIITRLRDREHVHAVLETVIRGAFMTGMKENFKLQGAKEAENVDAYQDVHGEHNRERMGLKNGEASLAASDQESAALTGQNTNHVPVLREENKRKGHSHSRIELTSVNGHTAAQGPFEVTKQEQFSYEHAATDVNVHMGYSLPFSDNCPKDVLMECLEVPESNQNIKCLGGASDDQKVLGQNYSNVTTAAESATGNVASCWLELLRLDIKGRLSALKRSRRRVRGVIVSGQLNDTKEKASQVDEMERWKAFFVHMERVLCLEGTRLESWLSQITQMQSSYCQKKSAPSYMPPSCGIGLLSVNREGASR